MKPGTLVLAASTLWMVGAGDAGAQTAGSGNSELDRAQALADSGRTDEARASLGAWYGASQAPEPVELSRARLLRARLASDPDSAELDYVWVAIEGDAAHAPEAFLRLAQLRLLRGEHGVPHGPTRTLLPRTRRGVLAEGPPGPPAGHALRHSIETPGTARADALPATLVRCKGRGACACCY